MNDIPEPWASAMVRARLTDPRYHDPRPSLGQLAEKAGIHTTTVSRMVHGTRKPSPENVQAVADALDVDVVRVSEWVKQARTVTRPYNVPAEVNLLTDREQDALSEFIRAIAATRKSDDDATPTTPAGGSPAKDAKVRTRRLSPRSRTGRRSGERPPSPQDPPATPPG